MAHLGPLITLAPAARPARGDDVTAWDLESGPTAVGSGISGTFTLYLWGFLVVFTLAVALGGWAWKQAHREGADTLWTYFVMALLWPLFVCAVLFMILWGILTSSHRRH